MPAAALKTVGTVIAAALTGLATANTFPAWTPVFSAIAGVLAGWLHLEKPKDSK